MTQLIQRRAFLTGLTSSIITAPAIVKAASLMPVRSIVWDIELPLYGMSPCMGALQDILDLEKIMQNIIKTYCVPEHYLRTIK